MKRKKIDEIGFVHTLEELKTVANNTRIYFGHEFCAYMLPSLNEINDIMRIAEHKNIGLTFVTPYVNESDLAKVKRLLEKIYKKYRYIEVVVNDWGIMNYIKENYDYEIILGRLLTKQKRGYFISNKNMEIMSIENLKLSKYDIEYLKSSILDNAYLSQYLGNIGVKRVGIDNLLIGLNNNKTRFSVDLYFPYCYLTTSNYCRTYLINKGIKRFERVANNCERYCLEDRRNITIAEREIILKGNTQFYKNDKMPSNLNRFNVDRIIIVKL